MIQSKRSNQFLCFFIFAALCLTYLWFWIEFTDPFPDRDSIHQLYFPYLNSLGMASVFSSDPLFLKSAFLHTYPWGIALVSSVIGTLGLSELAFNYPWHLPLLFCLPLCFIACSQDLDTRDKCLFMFILFFCPMVQIAIKSYSLHGLITLLTLPGALMFIRGLDGSSGAHLVLGLILIFYAATLKHLGLVHLLNLALGYFLWSLLRGQFSWKHFFVFGLGLLCLILFYPKSGLNDYINIAFSHNPRLDPFWFSILVFLLVCLLSVALVIVSKSSRRGNLPQFFRNGRGVLLSLLLAILMVSFGADQVGFELMILSFVTGYVALFFCIRNYDLRSVKGLMYILILFTFTHGSVLYFSFLGQIFANFFLPIGLIFVVSFNESSKTSRLLLASLALVLSNFSPNLDKSERWFWEWGHHFYSRGLNGMHQNPLGWHSSSLNALRQDVYSNLEKGSFDPFRRNYPILFSGLHFHTRLQFLNPPSIWSYTPEMILPERIRDDQLRALGRRLAESGGMEKVLQEGIFPIWIHSPKPWTQYPVYEHKCDDFQKIVGAEEAGWQDLLNDCLVQGLRYSKILVDEYNPFYFSAGKQKMSLFVHKSLRKKSVPEKFGLEEFRAQWNWYEELSFLDRISFTGVTPTDRSFEYFRRANLGMESGDWLGAWRWLQKGLKIEPDHKEMLQDLEIVEKELGHLKSQPSSQP